MQHDRSLKSHKTLVKAESGSHSLDNVILDFDFSPKDE